MSLIRLQNVSHTYEKRPVLREASLRIAAGERVGLVGRNGSGKTTLIRLILGQETPTEGRLDLNDGLRVGYFSQFSELHGPSSLQSILVALFDDIRLIEEDLEKLNVSLGGELPAEEMERLLERQAELIEEMERRGGWDYPRHIDTVCSKLGFDAARRLMPIDQLSGGWRNRASLARILLEAPDVLLLDEPTNYLDVEGLAWLETWLLSFRGGILLVSHDRRFLDQIATRIVEIENYHLQDYPGNYENYVRTKPFRMKNLARQFDHEEEMLALEAESAAERQELRRDPSDATRRKLADIKKRRPPRPVETIVTRIYSGLRAPDRCCRVEGLAKGYGGRVLFSDVSLELYAGERLGIVGPNGSGKSTLMRILTGSEKPDAGKVVWEGGTQFADFNAVYEALDPADTVTHAVNVTGMGFHAPRKHVNHFLGLLQFSEMDMAQRIGTLSGGQKARVALAQCLLSGAPVLLLDEPTNHLDLPSTQVMEQALIHFPGSVVVVSHDRFFLDKVCTRLLVLTRAGEHFHHNGNWTMWQSTQGEAG